MNNANTTTKAPEYMSAEWLDQKAKERAEWVRWMESETRRNRENEMSDRSLRSRERNW
jgi:hypothetical protein